MSEIENLKKIEDLSKEIKALKDRLDPPPRPPSTWQPRDLTEGMSMPRNAMQAMIDAVPESVMADLRADARRPNPVTTGSSPITSTQQPAKPKGGTNEK